jgi:hypothetical protein
MVRRRLLILAGKAIAGCCGCAECGNRSRAATRSCANSSAASGMVSARAGYPRGRSNIHEEIQTTGSAETMSPRRRAAVRQQQATGKPYHGDALHFQATCAFSYITNLPGARHDGVLLCQHAPIRRGRQAGESDRARQQVKTKSPVHFGQLQRGPRQRTNGSKSSRFMRSCF